MLLFIYALLLLSVKNTYASTFGQSCSALPIVDSTNYLNNDTAYGFIKQNLDMQTYVADACRAQNDTLTFCIKNKSGTSPICTPVIMRIGESNSLSNITTNPEIINQPSIAAIILSVALVKTKVCLTMPTSRGMMPILCRDRASKNILGSEAIKTCQTLGKSCYDGSNKSQSILSFSGVTVNCLRDTLNRVFYVGNQCPASTDNVSLATLKPFPEFQKNMKLAVKAGLILYVMIFGFKIIMNNEYAHFNKIATFVLKLIIVLYFAVGLGETTIEQGVEVQQNGMTSVALPLLVEMSSNFTSYVFEAAGAKGLCHFDKSKYINGYEFYQIWDAIDCRIGYYLGLQILHDSGTILNSLNSTIEASVGSKVDWGNKSTMGLESLYEIGVFVFFPILFGFLMAGNIIIVIMGIMFVLSLMSVLFYFISAYLVCMVTLYVMAYISPIFIPMMLFERTKGYFDSWLRIVIGTTLQPAVIGCFIALLLTIYDSAIYGNCEFQRHNYINGETNFSTFELRLPETEVEKCKSSFGFKMMELAISHGWSKKSFMIFESSKINDNHEITISLLCMMLYVVIFYFFMQSVNKFASELSGGLNMGSVTVSTNEIIDQDEMTDLAQKLAIASITKNPPINNDSSKGKGPAEALRALITSSTRRKNGVSEKLSSISDGGSSSAGGKI